MEFSPSRFWWSYQPRQAVMANSIAVLFLYHNRCPGAAHFRNGTPEPGKALDQNSTYFLFLTFYQVPRQILQSLRSGVEGVKLAKCALHERISPAQRLIDAE